MSLPFFIAKRHIFSRHKIGYISFISIISTIGLAVGVAALILTVSILNGFEREIKSKLMGFDAHIRLRLFYNETMDTTQWIEDTIAQYEQVVDYIPYVHSNVMIRHGREADGVVVEGIREADIRKTLNIDRFLVEGKLQFQLPDGKSGIVMGKKLAQLLQADIGDEVFLFVLHGRKDATRRPKIGRFQLTGIYDSGISDYDDIFVYTGLEAAQKLFNLGNKFSGYQILLDDPLQADQIAGQLNKTLGFPYHALTWNDLHSNLFEWLRVQRLPILIVFGLIAIVAVFNLVSSLMMIVIEKTRDIGILKSLGLANQKITRIFLLEGLIIGIAGTALGFALALFLAWLQNHFGLIRLPMDVYFMNQLPILLNWQQFVYVGILILLLTIIATIYPAVKAVKLPPAEALRYE